MNKKRHWLFKLQSGTSRKCGNDWYERILKGKRVERWKDGKSCHIYLKNSIVNSIDNVILGASHQLSLLNGTVG